MRPPFFMGREREGERERERERMCARDSEKEIESGRVREKSVNERSRSVVI
jgi:hypothetical protein